MVEAISKTGYYPNKFGRIILLAMEEILGRNGINAVLNQSRQPEWINNYPPNNLDRQFQAASLSRLQIAMEEIYGPLGGHGLAIRSGRACFKHALRELGADIGLTDINFKLLPLTTKIHQGTKLLTEALNRYTDQDISAEEDNDHYYLVTKRCRLCWGRHSDIPVCHLTVGVLQEALFWVSNGRSYNIEETLCIARGDPSCIIRIDKEPID